MPPKKAKKESVAPTRRSARIQSREPSVETETLPPIEVQVEPPQRSPSPPPQEPAEEQPLMKYTRMRRELTLQKIHDEYVEKLEEEKAAKLQPASHPTPSRQPLSWVPATQGASPQQQHVVEVATTPAALNPPPSAEKQPAWRKILSSFGDYFTSPFTRKRHAEEDYSSPPTSKRVRVQETTAERANAQEVAHHYEESVAPTPDIAERAQETFTPVQKTPSAQTPLNAPTPDIAERAQEAPTPVQFQPSAQTPQTAQKHQSPRDYAGPSTKDSRMPTSLSTITEYTEPSFFSHLSQIVEGTPTPSKYSRNQPQQSSRLDVPETTPLPPRSTPSLLSRQNTPRRTPLGTPYMRRAAQLRAAREAAELGTPRSTSLFGSASTAPPKPKETNADARRAKLERMRALQKELDELQADEDIKELQAQRRKRVKIDNLAAIPHNLPGDPSGMFRVPEGDSDDEMEVYDDVEERSNVFEDAEAMQDVQHQQERQQLRQQQLQEQQKQKQQQQQQQQAQQYERTERSSMVFEFPDAGPVPRGYHVSEEYKRQACELFEQGFAEWLAAGGSD